MPSPVKPSDFCSLAPTPSTSACESIKRLFFAFPQLLCDLVTYIFDEDGNVTDEFKSDTRQIPAGTLFDFAGLSAPSGFLPCDGRAVSRTDYDILFAAIGTLWGDGDGSTTFNLPDFRDKFVLGSSATRATGSSGGTADSSVVSHRHGIGRFELGNDNGWFFVDAYTNPETRDTQLINGDRSTAHRSTEPEGEEFGGTNETKPGILSTTPIQASTVTNGNIPPYVAVTKIIKT
jgi:hypothetical protein